jgi:hypothetical protein
VPEPQPSAAPGSPGRAEPTGERARFVRQFALTRGRARSIGRDLPLETLVQATAAGRGGRDHLDAEQAAVIDLCPTPIAIAELSAHLGTHLGVARVIVSDMVVHDLVAVSDADLDADGPDLATLERLLDDLQAL